MEDTNAEVRADLEQKGKALDRVIDSLEHSRTHLLSLREQVAEALQQLDELLHIVRQQPAPEDTLRHWQEEFDKIVKRVHGEV